MKRVLAPVRAALSHHVFIHPGMVRTATSTLQRHVFTNHHEIFYLGLPAPSDELHWAVTHVCQADSVHLEPDRLHDVFEAAIGIASHDQKVMISYENFAFCKSKDKGLIAERLHALFPQASILFTIRRQEDLVVSRYLTDLRKLVKLRSFIEFEDWYWFGYREAYRHIFDDLYYNEIISYYIDLFGKSQVHVHLFEQLKEDAAAFSAGFAGSLGVSPREFHELLGQSRDNAAMTRAYYQFWRHFGHLLPRRIVRKLSRRTDHRPGKPARVEMSAEIRAHLASIYSDGNARLMATVGVDLARHGYCLPGTEKNAP
jgi:hypothetical protein